MLRVDRGLRDNDITELAAANHDAIHRLRDGHERPSLVREGAIRLPGLPGVHYGSRLLSDRRPSLRQRLEGRAAKLKNLRLDFGNGRRGAGVVRQQ